jgi:hypothetical protein
VLEARLSPALEFQYTALSLYRFIAALSSFIVALSQLYLSSIAALSQLYNSSITAQ